MTTSQQLASIPAADIALLGGGRLAKLGCRSAPSIVAIALAYPDALVDGFDDDAAAHRRGPGRGRRRARDRTGRVPPGRPGAGPGAGPAGVRRRRDAHRTSATSPSTSPATTGVVVVEAA